MFLSQREREREKNIHSSNSPSGVEVSFLRPELAGARQAGSCWCSGDLTMADIINCCRDVAGFVELL